jgi:hypothetical protein
MLFGREVGSGRGVHRIAPLLALAMTLSACGQDAGGGGEEEAKGTPKAESAAAIQEYCSNVVALETVPEPDIDFDAPPEQQAEETKKFARGTIRPLADEVVQTAPDAIKEETSLLSREFRKVEETGDIDAFVENPRVKQAFTTTHRYDLENCDWTRVNVTGTDYAFTGVPPELKVGINSFEFTNNGAELHEMLILQKNPGTRETFDQLLAMPQEEAMKKATPKAATFGEPREEGLYDVADLDAGQYAMVCFVPVGSTPEAAKAAEEANREVEGPPHFTRGMKIEFTVK